MSRKLSRGARRTRHMRLESLESRDLMHGLSLCAAPLESQEADPTGPSVVAAAAEVSAAAPSSTSSTSRQEPARAELDANGNGRVELDELRRWLRLWRDRSSASPQPDPAPSAPPKPPAVLPAVDDYGSSSDWHLNAIGAPESWAAGHTGEGVVVAVIDTGADLTHRELADALWTNPDEIPGNGRDDDGNGHIDDVHGWDFVGDDAVPQDRNGHGTHVASLIVGARDGRGSTGAAYGAELMVLQGLGANGVGSTADLARAVRYAVDEGADVINLSLSGARSSALESALRYAAANDVLVVAAAGNQGAARASAPASLSAQLTNVLAVGAIDRDGRLASFSNRAGDAVQIVAPGVRLRAAVPGGYGVSSGTSMATPLVSAVAALALSANPDLGAAELRRLLVEGAGGAGDRSTVNAAKTVAQAAIADAVHTSRVSTRPLRVAAESLPQAAATASVSSLGGASSRSHATYAGSPWTAASDSLDQDDSTLPILPLPLPTAAVDECLAQWAA